MKQETIKYLRKMWNFTLQFGFLFLPFLIQNIKIPSYCGIIIAVVQYKVLSSHV